MAQHPPMATEQLPNEDSGRANASFMNLQPLILINNASNPMSSDATSCDEKVLRVKDLIAQHIREGNVRCDEEYLKRSPEFCEGNAVHETLGGHGLIEEYCVYRKAGDPEITCIVSFGDKVNGHPGIVHGGIISTVFDNTFGWLFTILDYPSSFTANLNVNFR